MMQRADSLENILVLEKTEGTRRRVVKEVEVVGLYYRLNGHEIEHTPEDNAAQGSLAYCSPWGRREMDTT